MHTFVYMGLFSPLLGFLVLLFASKVISRKQAGIIGCASIFISFVCFSYILYSDLSKTLHAENFTLFKWISYKELQADFTLHLDTLALLMTLIITGIGFLIHLYSIGYMDHEEDFCRYFACMNLFIFAMLLLVLAGNLLLLFVGWEGVGLASYLLIGYWYYKPAAAQAATKAFVVNRIGDLGLLLAILLTIKLFGTSDITEVCRLATHKFAAGDSMIALLALLCFCGAIGKSAQLPLHVWLPDAMEGPTPVSALIHAATMVTAGVYLVVRLHPIFELAPQILHLVGYVGATTSLFAALCAIGQTDLKRVLAYSTISQLGLMFLACGVDALYAAMFHLTTHAFVKALLFLSAGNVVHMMHGTTQMDKMGGLSKRFTKTHLLFLIGVLAMSGVPPLAAFFSKDLILEEEFAAGFDTLFYVALVVSVLTAFYLTRAYCLAFMGKPPLEKASFESIQEAPRIMLVPVAVLAFLSVFGGFLGFSLGKSGFLESFLAENDPLLDGSLFSHGFHLNAETWISLACALTGIVLSVYMYLRFVDNFRAPLRVLTHAFFIDAIYKESLWRPLNFLAKSIADFWEPKIFDGFIGITLASTDSLAGRMQKLQSGQIRSYVAWMALGAVVLVIYLIV